MARSDDYITEVRAANKAIWDGINKLMSMQREWVAQDYNNTLPDGSGSNNGITSQEISDVVNTTANALNALLNEGHSTNMSALL